MLKKIGVGVTALIVGLFAVQQTVPAEDISYSEATLTTGGVFQTGAVGSVSSSSIFQVGSISKFACTLAIMDMQREGRLTIDSPLSEILPGYTGAAADTITLTHLLQNRSGLEDGIMTAFRADQSLATASINAIEASNRFAAGTTKFAPGSAFDYIIANWIIVQAVLEYIDGLPIGEVLQSRVFDPAKMEDAKVFSGVLTGPDVAVPINPARPVPDFLTCAGGVASTAADLLKLVRHPYRTAGFSRDELAQLTEVATEAESYALGGRYNTMKINDTVHVLSWQSGSNGAYKSIAVYDPLLDIGYAIATADDARTAIESRRDCWVLDFYPD